MTAEPALRWAARPPPFAVDVGVAFAVGAVFVAVRLAVGDVSPAGVAATLLAVAPLAWRRRAPVAALAVAVVAEAGVVALGEPEIGLALVGFGLALSAAAAGAGAAPLRRVVLVAVAALAVRAAAVALNASVGEVASATASSAVGFALAIVLGDNLRRRRQRVADLHERVLLAERELELEIRNAVDTERIRIARELHDVVAHGVSLVVVQAGAGQRLVHRDPVAGHDALTGIERTAREAMVQLRGLLDVLRPDRDEPVADAPQPDLSGLRALVEAGEPIARLVESGTRPVLTPHLELHAYRIVQESLTNARKHAPGAQVVVSLTYKPHELVVEITDTGPGTGRPRPAPPHLGHGLLGMRERAHLTGGSVQAGPRVDGPGWRVVAHLPTRGGR